MKALFVGPNPYYASGINEATVYPPLGLVYISSLLEKNGFDSMVFDAFMSRASNNKILEIISLENPDIIGVSANIVTAKAANELLTLIKNEFKDKTTICGGPLPTVMPEVFLSHCDIVVRGEGEGTVLDIVKGEKLETIDGISFKNNGKIIHNKARELIRDLDQIPFPNYHLLKPNLNKYKCRARKLPVAPLLTSRGCPYNCIFCNKSIFGHTFRARSPENILQEVDHLINDFGVKQLDILDDNFTLDIKRAEKFLDMLIEKNYDLLINCQNCVRADGVTRELIHKMKLAGVFKVGIGIESGDKEILKKIKKQLDLERVKQVIKWFNEVNIVTYGFFMLGFPWDVPKTMQKTIDFAKESNPDIANFMITIPFPGTELYEYVIKNAKLLQKIEEGVFCGFYGNRVFFETNALKQEDVSKYFEKAYKEFYVRPKKIMELLLTPKSLDEFKWIIEASLVIFKSLLNKD